MFPSMIFGSYHRSTKVLFADISPKRLSPVAAPSTIEVSISCAGAWRLGRFDGTGMAAFANSTDVAWRSFYAAVLIAPLWMLVSLLRYAIDPSDVATQTPLLRYLTVEIISYVIGWTAFPVIMAGVCEQLGRTSTYPRFVAAYNWSMLIQYMIYLPVVLAGLTGLVPEQGAMFLSLITLFWALAFETFVIKSALNIPLTWAAAFTAFDLFLAVLIRATADVVL